MNIHVRSSIYVISEAAAKFENVVHYKIYWPFMNKAMLSKCFYVQCTNNSLFLCKDCLNGHCNLFCEMIHFCKNESFFIEPKKIFLFWKKYGGYLQPAAIYPIKGFLFLAHLSQKLRGELVVYQCALYQWNKCWVLYALSVLWNK